MQLLISRLTHQVPLTYLPKPDKYIVVFLKGDFAAMRKRWLLKTIVLSATVAKMPYFLP
jgi:hypothetical protein